MGVSYTGSSQKTILYSAGDRSLIFDLEKSYAQDSAGNVSYPGALRRNGTIYVLAYQVAKYFDLVYSVLEVENGHLVWLRQSSFNMTDKQFDNAASYPCAASRLPRRCRPLYDNLYFYVAGPDHQLHTELWVVEHDHLAQWAALHPELPMLEDLRKYYQTEED